MYTYKNVEDVKLTWPMIAALIALVAGFVLSLGMPAVDTSEQPPVSPTMQEAH